MGSGGTATNDFATCVTSRASEDPDAVAVVAGHRAISYEELEARIRRAESALSFRGINERDRVAVCSVNRIEIVELLFACCRLGATLLVINNRLTSAEISTQFDDCRPSLVLTEVGFMDRFDTGRWRVEDLDTVANEPYVRSTSPPGSLGRPDHPALLVYTSGTTGRPKGAVLSQRSLLHTMYNAIDHERLSTDSTVLAVLPMFHVGGLNIQLTPCLFAGGTVILEEHFDPARLLELLRQHRPTHLALVPAAMRSLAEATTQLGDDLSSLGALTCGSSIVPPDLIRYFAKHDISVVQVYGATETGPTAIVLDPNDADRIGSCGKPALHTELRVIASTGREAMVGEVGELRLRGPNLFVGYWEDPRSTEAAFADGWYRTGDLGFVDKDGFTYVTGRVKELIISGGENVYPAEIEQVLEQHDRIESAAVIGRPDERWGESPAAFVVPSASPAPTEAELSAWVRTRLAGYKQPRLWIFVDELPMTSLGKVRKDELRRALEEG